MRINLEGDNFAKTPINVYDADRQELVTTYPSIAQASKVLGVTQSCLQKALARKSRIQPESNRLGKTLAIRIAKTQK